MLNLLTGPFGPIIKYGAIALAFVAAVWWVREDAKTDVLREIQLRQLEATTDSLVDRNERRREIENASPDDLRRLACDSGLLSDAECVD